MLHYLLTKSVVIWKKIVREICDGRFEGLVQPRKMSSPTKSFFEFIVHKKYFVIRKSEGGLRQVV
jgi:hypothetical protein